jgi:hypothetical protein
MQRVNGHSFYDLALKIHPLVDLTDQHPLKGAFFILMEARQAILDLFSLIPLRVCVPVATGIAHNIDGVLPRDWREAIKVFPADDEVKIGYAAHGISQGAREFETILAAELQSLDTYLVSQKGTHSTPDLIDRAEIMFPEPIRKRLPPQAVIDIRQAGRCLALDNPTASAFHVLRAVESVMAMYFELVTGKPLPTRMRNWAIYLKALRKHPDYSERVVTLLDHIRDSYRNPILHPDVVVTEDEAESLLGTSASAIRLIVMEIKVLEQRSQSLPLALADPESPAAVA